LALVPAHGEEDTIARTVKSLASVEAVDRVVVVADGCHDGTVHEALGAGATVLTTGRRIGKGGAVEQVLDRLPAAEIYALVDGDVGDTAVEVGKLIEEVAAGKLDVAIGRLPPLTGGGFGLVKSMAAWLIRRAGRFEAEAPLSGQRALTREALDACRPLAAGFGLETAMTMDLVRLGFRVGEIPVDMTHRPTGRGIDGFVHRGRQGLEIVAAALPRLVGLR
jgi:glycosyltransferase involved in cell wall biosynthesis